MCRILERKTHEAFIESQFKILLALVDFGLRKIFNPTNTVHGSIHCGSSVRISQFFRYGQDSLFRLRSFPEDAPQVRGCSCGLYLFYVCELLNLFNRFGPFTSCFFFFFFFLCLGSNSPEIRKEDKEWLCFQKDSFEHNSWNLLTKEFEL